jgi:hypothetical protein
MGDGTNNNAITPALYKDLDFDAVKDFGIAPHFLLEFIRARSGTQIVSSSGDI